jgi:hypothetical protein
MPQSGFDPYYLWLGIPPHEQPPTLYRLLGISLFEENQDVIDRAADGRLALLKTVQVGPHPDLSQRLMMEVSSARVRLLDADSKAHYDASLRASCTTTAPPPPPVEPEPLPESPISHVAYRQPLTVREGWSKQSNDTAWFTAKVLLGGVVGLGLGYLIVVHVLHIDLSGKSPAVVAHPMPAKAAASIPPARQPTRIVQQSKSRPAPAPPSTINQGQRPMAVMPPQPSEVITPSAPPSSSANSQPSLGDLLPAQSPPTPQAVTFRYSRFGDRSTRETDSSEDWKTLKSWIGFATDGATVESRMEASNALLAIVKRHAAGTQLLDDEQQELLRTEALKLLTKKDGDPVRVLQILGPVADYSCRQRILTMTKHRTPQVRLAAIEALATVVDDSCVDELADIIRKDEVVPNQLAAVKLLAGMATPRANAEIKRLSKQRLQGSVQDSLKSAADRLML